MIPKRAIFYWQGPPMGWLRRQSVETFRSLNPTWEVVLMELPSEASLLTRVHASDIARYTALAEGGGLYFDTDIIFCRPVPEGWLRHELLLPLDELGLFSHVACLGGAPASPFFKAAAHHAAELLSRGHSVNYQGFGVNLLREVMLTMSLGTMDVKWIAHDCFVPVPWCDVAKLWNDWTAPFPPMAIGIHWYGGDHLSIDMADSLTLTWPEESKSLIARAWRRAQSATRETVGEQHGFA